MNDDYANRQAIHEREYLDYYQSPEYLRWVESLSAEDRCRLEADGLLQPLIDRSGTTLRDEDACLSNMASEEDDVLTQVDLAANVQKPDNAPVAEPGTDERLWDILRRLLGELLNQKNAKLTIECLAVVSGIGFLGDSMTEIAERNGVTRAAVSKRCVELTLKLKLNPSRAMRSLTARVSYAQTQHILRHKYEERNRKSR
ncbi:MAG: hypothetical protein ACFUZC_07470 [Chthoniobacteraceae bacterium]